MSDLGNTQFFRVPQEQKLGVEEILEYGQRRSGSGTGLYCPDGERV